MENVKKEAYRKKIEAKYEQGQAKLAQLDAKIKELSAEAEIKAREEYSYLKSKLADIKLDLEKLKKSGSREWEDTKERLERSWHELTRKNIFK